MDARDALRDDGTARSIGRLLGEAEQALRSVSTTARLDAELLLAMTLRASRASLLAFPERLVSLDRAARFRTAVERRSSGEPLAYLTGEKEFYSLALHVTRGVLVPRAETELLVDAALGRFGADEAPTVLDLGTGSGAVALAIKRQRPLATVTAVDCARPALAAARDNARRLDLDVRFVESSWFDALRDERFDLVVANPPYIASGDPHFAGPLKYEPRMALDGGADGLDAYRAILRDAPRHLSSPGLLMLEHGYDQRAQLCELAGAHGFATEGVYEDLSGVPRVAVFKRG